MNFYALVFDNIRILILQENGKGVIPQTILPVFKI